VGEGLEKSYKTRLIISSYSSLQSLVKLATKLPYFQMQLLIAKLLNVATSCHIQITKFVYLFLSALLTIRLVSWLSLDEFVTVAQSHSIALTKLYLILINSLATSKITTQWTWQTLLLLVQWGVSECINCLQESNFNSKLLKLKLRGDRGWCQLVSIC